MIAWALFIPACFALNCAPGPNNMLAFSNAARLGFFRAMLGGLGRMPAFTFLIFLTVVGLGAVLSASTAAFTIIKMTGAVYLVYVGVHIFLKAKALARAQASEANVLALMRRDFTMAISNPKAIAIFTAFFPQFLDPSMAAWPQLLAMGAAFLVMEVVAVMLYASAGTMLSKVIRSDRIFILLNRVVGAALVVAGGSMAFSRR